MLWLSVLFGSIVMLWRRDITSHQPFSSGWSTCPERCTCKYLWLMSGILVDCSNLGLNRFPVSIPVSTLELDVSHNNIDSMPSINMHSLVLLDLNDNNLGDSGVQKIAELNAPELSDLNVAANKLHRLPEDLPNTVRRLDLSNNRISLLRCHLVSNLPPLHTLILAGNRLTVITADDFCPDRMQVPDAPHISLVATLQRLDLSRNQIHSIDDGAFRCFLDLQELNLAYNLLMYIGWNSFANISSLRKLDLSHNHIWHVDAGAFLYLSQLEILNLGYNRLSDVPSNLPLINIVDISGNAISCFDENPALLRIRHLLVAHNPLNCDCRLLWIKEHLIRSASAEVVKHYCSSLKVSDPDRMPRCALPISLAGEPLHILPNSSFICCDVPASTSSCADQKQQRPNPDTRRHPKPRKNYLSLGTNNCYPGQDCYPKEDQNWVWIKDISCSCLTVAWNVPPGLVSYRLDIVHYPFGKREDRLIDTVSAAVGQYHISGLHPDTSYVVCVVPRHCQNSPTDPVLLESCLEVRTKKVSLLHRLCLLLLSGCSVWPCVFNTIILFFLILGITLICLSGCLWLWDYYTYQNEKIE